LSESAALAVASLVWWGRDCSDRSEYDNAPTEAGAHHRGSDPTYTLEVEGVGREELVVDESAVQSGAEVPGPDFRR
jgi:hypothetical protein